MVELGARMKQTWWSGPRVVQIWGEGRGDWVIVKKVWRFGKVQDVDGGGGAFYSFFILLEMAYVIT